MLKAIGYIVFATGVALWLAGCATGAPASAATQPEHSTNSAWQEYNTAVQEECDIAVAQLAIKHGVTAETIKDPEVQRILRDMRWQCAHQQGLTL